MAFGSSCFNLGSYWLGEWHDRLDLRRAANKYWSGNYERADNGL
jgi:hypothetical protein